MRSARTDYSLDIGSIKYRVAYIDQKVRLWKLVSASIITVVIFYLFACHKVRLCFG